MARPIKATPVLTGADARRFEKAMENVQKISPEKREEMMKAYEWFKRAAKFPVRAAKGGLDKPSKKCFNNLNLK